MTVTSNSDEKLEVLKSTNWYVHYAAAPKRHTEKGTDELGLGHVKISDLKTGVNKLECLVG